MFGCADVTVVVSVTPAGLVCAGAAEAEWPADALNGGSRIPV